MKSMLYFFLLAVFTIFYSSCSLIEDDENSIDGDQSPMGEVGITMSSSSDEISGVKDFAVEVTSVKDGISTAEGKAVVTNTFVKNLLSNFPEVTFKGDTATTKSLKFQNTKEGIAIKSGPSQGILVKYNSNVGDKYPIDGVGGERAVVSKSTDDDYWYGFMLIKVLEVEEYTTTLRSTGVSKVTYWGNHKFGLVGVTLTFDDATTAHFPLYTSAENK
jgi:hypothetical protein